MKNVITSAEQVTPDWLTSVLHDQGVLPHGGVVRVIPGEMQSTFASSVWHLELNYSKGVSTNAPKKLFLKCSNPALVPGEFDPKLLQQEIIFYQTIAPAMAESFTIPCYTAVYEPETRLSHILLKDVSETHIPCSTPPNQKNYEQAVDTLARLHAFWWDHPSLGKNIGKFPTQAERQQEWIHAEKATTAFVALLGDQLPQSWRKIYEGVLTALPYLYKRHATGQNLTLVHGDAHPGNFLFSIDADAEKAYILDWQFWHPTIGGTDLAFLLATESEMETRRLLEQTLLRRYHHHLLAHGVQSYSWDDCWNDYRLSVILVSIFIPVWRWSLFQWKADMCALERSMTAYEELNCSDLL